MLPKGIIWFTSEQIAGTVPTCLLQQVTLPEAVVRPYQLVPLSTHTGRSG
jgi:hypothetical protein